QDIVLGQTATQTRVLGDIERLPGGLYATGYDGQYLVTIDPQTGAGGYVGYFGTYWTYAAAFTPDGTLWTVAYAWDPSLARLATVDTTTGQVTLVGSPDWT